VSPVGNHQWFSGWWFGSWLLFFHILGIFGNVIIPTYELIFFRGVAQPPTSYSCSIQRRDADPTLDGVTGLAPISKEGPRYQRSMFAYFQPSTYKYSVCIYIYILYICIYIYIIYTYIYLFNIYIYLIYKYI